MTSEETNWLKSGSNITLGNSLSPKQKREVLEVVKRYEPVFYRGGKLPVVEIGVEHTVRLEDGVAPIASRPRRLNSEAEREVRKELEKLYRMGKIRRSNSPWAAPVVCARRPDGSLRLAIDYRLLNDVSFPATLHPIPLIEDLLDRLSTAKYFSVLDAKAGYHQMPLREEDSEVTAFVVPWAHFEWADCTPFGLKGAGYSFQRMMATVLGECNFVEALCYLDDILIWGESWEQHLDRLGRVLEKVKSAGLMLGMEKCKFGVQKVQYLGSVIGEGMVSISEQRVTDLVNLPRPNTVKQLRSALGAFGFIQRWLPGIAEVAKPLYSGVTGKPHSKLQWTVEMNQSFNKLKKLVAGASALQIPDQNKEFTLITDCSNTGAGAVLLQEDKRGGETMAAVAYYHHALNRAEQRYTTTDKELLAAVLAIRKFRVYLTKRFNLLMDHSALRWVKTMNMEDVKGRRARWLEMLQQYDINWVHKSGKSPEMAMADYLSRVVMEKKSSLLRAELEKDRSVSEGLTAMIGTAPEHEKKDECISEADIKKAQAEDEACSIIREVLMMSGMQEVTEQLENHEKATKIAETVEKKDWRRLQVDERGILFMEFNGGRKTSVAPMGIRKHIRIVLPVKLRREIFNLIHNSKLGGHMGQDRTWKRLRNSFYWRNMKKDIDTWVNECEPCGRNKHNTHPNVAPFQDTDIPVKPFQQIQIDFLGPFPVAESHPYRYVYEIQDILSRYAG